MANNENQQENINNNAKQAVSELEEVAKPALVIMAEKGKANITELIIDVKKRDGTLQMEELENALKYASTKEVQTVLQTEINALKKQEIAKTPMSPEKVLSATKEVADVVSSMRKTLESVKAPTSTNISNKAVTKEQRR